MSFSTVISPDLICRLRAGGQQHSETASKLTEVFRGHGHAPLFTVVRSRFQATAESSGYDKKPRVPNNLQYLLFVAT